MKKFLIILAIVFGFILLAAVLIPVIFKDDIRAAVDKELNNAVNAKVYYDPDAFSLSLIRDFPDLTVSVSDFGVVGVAPFETDTLADIRNFRLTLDILSVIRGDQIEIVSVTLDEPNIYILVLEDGTANYDIAKASEEEQPADTASPAVNVQINGWEINNGAVIYEDRSLPMLVLIEDLNHSGSGDFAQEVFDMATQTQIDGFTFNYDGVEYISSKSLTADITMAMDLANMKFTFRENRVALNNFGFGFDGFISMPAEDIEMDITFAGKEIDLTSVLSLIPGAYQEYLDGVNASGQVGFDGYVRGVFNEESMPVVLANFGIQDGKIAYSDYPVPMEDIQVNAQFNYPSADPAETTFTMDKFHMALDGEEVTASLFFKDLEDYYWDFKVNGSIDLGKLTQIIPVEGAAIKGTITAALDTKGRMSDLEAERYSNLPTTGSLGINGFSYQGEDFPQGVGISQAELTFNPDAILLTSFKATSGNSDFNLSGRVTNYLNYALADSAVLSGNLDFYSSLIDANELMGESPEEETEDTTAMEVVRVPEDIDFVLTSQIDVLRYDNLELKDFGGKVIVRGGALTLENTGFNLLDGTFKMDGAYESAVALEQPLYNFDFVINDLSIPAAFENFNTIQKLVPVAEKMTGRFSSDFRIGGTIGNDMLPVYEDMHGAGLVEIASASLKDVKTLELISSVSKLNQGDGEVTLRDVTLSVEIKGGRLFVEPFDMELYGRKATISGSNGLDGSIDYKVDMEVPSGQVGQALSSAISSVAGIDDAIGKSITLNLGVTGTYDDPDVKLLGAESGAAGSGGIKSAITAKAKEELEKKKEQISEELTQKKDSVVSEVKEKAEAKKEEVEGAVKEEVDEATEKATEEVKDKAKDAVKDIFGKKKKDGG